MKFVLLILLLLFPVLVRADEPRRVTSFKSPNGQYVFQTLNQPQYRKWSLIETATKKVLYEITGDFSSLTVLVGYDGKNLVMIDDFSESRAEDDPEVLQFFLEGKKVKSYKLSDLLENTQNVMPTVSHFMWIARPLLTRNFAFDRSTVSFTTFELNKFTFDINTGEIIERKRDTELEEERKKYKAAQEEKRKEEIKKSMLRFDGFYCEPNEDGRTCLRFYEDGLVLAVALGKQVTDESLITAVPKWFTREPDKKGNYLSEGTYKISEYKITFTESIVYNDEKEKREVKVDYKGSIKDSGNVLMLDSYSHYNGNRQKGRRFEFVKIAP